MLKEFPIEIVNAAPTPAAAHLFKVNPTCRKLIEKKSQEFHTTVAQDSLCAREPDRIYKQL